MAAKITEADAKALFMKNKLEPLVSFPGTQKPWKSKCLITGKTVSPTYGKVRDFGHRCVYCSRGVIEPQEALRVMKKSGFMPLVAFPGSNKPWKSKCTKCKKTTSPTYWNVAKGTGCKYCSGRAVEPSDAVKAMKKRGLETLEPFPGATKGWSVRCLNCERQFKAVFHSLNTKNGCKYCSGVAVVESELLERLAELRLKPLEKYQSAKTPWRCKCLVCNHVVQPTWMRIKQGRGHCAYCSQRRVDIPEAMKFMKSIDLKPLIEFPGNNKPWLCKCLKCKAEVTPRWSDLRRGQGGCSNCADYGLNYQKPGYLYLITNTELKSHKIGIANSYKSRKFDDRMYQHEKRGWTLYKKLSFKTVKEASDIETKVLEWLRMEVGLSFHLTSKQMPQGGHTETVAASEIELVIMWAKVLQLAKVKT
jgi:recombinational DNA repair protein (RecF pathway)